MSDDTPSGRLSQIFDSLSCLSELQKQQLSQSQVQYSKQRDGANFGLPSGSQTIPSSSSQNQIFTSSSSASSSPSMSKRGLPPGTGGMNTPPQTISRITTSGCVGVSQSTPNSPRLMPRRMHKAPPIPARPNAAIIANPALVALDSDAPWPHFSSLTDHLDVHQVNNYNQAVPEVLFNLKEESLEVYTLLVGLI